MSIIIDVLLLLGVVFALAGVIGILKMPDTFSRMQASTCVSTLGVVFMAAAGIIYALAVMGSVGTAVKIGVILVLVITVNPVGSHVIARGAYEGGIRPEKEMEKDDLRRDIDG